MKIASATPKRSKIAEYDVLRVILTLFVIAGHCTIMDYAAMYGSFSYPACVTKSYTLFRILNTVIGVFHMPLFMALSGALFYRTLKGGKYDDLQSLIKDKARRLLVPFFLVCILYEFPIKCMTGYYRNGDPLMGLAEIVFGELLTRGATHMWFLPSLFYIFLIVGALELYWPGHQKTKLFLFIVWYMISGAMRWNAHNSLWIGLWFYIGYLFEPHREKTTGEGYTWMADRKHSFCADRSA